MEATNRHNCRKWSEEKVSSAVLIMLVAASIVMFALFFSTGYDEPWEENTEFIAPEYTGSLIGFMFFILGAACITAIGSVLWNSRCHGSILNTSGGIPAGKIAAAVIIILAATMSVTYLTASDTAILINGRSYTDSSWLCVTDMLIHTIEILFVIAVAAVIYGMSGINRHIQKH